MLRKIKTKLIVAATLLAALMPLGVMSSPAYAALTQTNTNSALCNGSNVSNLDNPTTGCNPDSSVNGGRLEDKVTKAINLFSVIVGIVAVVMVIYGGFRYVTSGGKQESVTSAKNTLLYAVIGLVIVALAQAIVHFVLKSTTS